MAESIHNYEQVSIYPLDADVQEKLLTINRECVFNWCTRDNWPMGRGTSASPPARWPGWA